jgi:hypothetical protein
MEMLLETLQLTSSCLRKAPNGQKAGNLSNSNGGQRKGEHQLANALGHYQSSIWLTPGVKIAAFFELPTS